VEIELEGEFERAEADREGGTAESTENMEMNEVQEIAEQTAVAAEAGQQTRFGTTITGSAGASLPASSLGLRKLRPLLLCPSQTSRLRLSWISRSEIPARQAS